MVTLFPSHMLATFTCHLLCLSLMSYMLFPFNSIYCPSAKSLLLLIVFHYFFSKFCVFQDLSIRKLIEMGEVQDDLYNYKQVPSTTIHSQKLPTPTFSHHHLGNPSSPCIPKTLSIPPFKSTCDVCIWAKHALLSFSLNHNKSSFLFIEFIVTFGVVIQLHLILGLTIF